MGKSYGYRNKGFAKANLNRTVNAIVRRQSKGETCANSPTLCDLMDIAYGPYEVGGKERTHREEYGHKAKRKAKTESATFKKWTEIIVLTEILDTKVKVKVKMDAMGSFNANFFVGKEEFAFDAHFLSSEATDFPKGWDEGFEVSFSRWFKNEWQFDTLSNMSTREALTVFSGVKKCMDLWVKSMRRQDEPLDFFFTAKSAEASRSKLYDKFAKNIAKTLKLDGPVISKAAGKKFYAFEDNNG